MSEKMTMLMTSKSLQDCIFLGAKQMGRESIEAWIESLCANIEPGNQEHQLMAVLLGALIRMEEEEMG